jgi:hypothetical protein
MPRTALIAVWGIVAFVVLDIAAILLADEAYSAREDYVSSLAGRGSSVWVVEVAALACFAAAHIALGLFLLRSWRLRVAGTAVMVSGLIIGVAAVVRAGCPQGEAGCAFAGNYDEDAISSLHGMAAGVYMLAMTLAMLLAAVSSYRAHGLRRWVLLAALPLAVLAWYALTQMEASGANGDTGLWERVWLGCNAAWILLVGGSAAFSREPARLVSAEV